MARRTLEQNIVFKTKQLRRIMVRENLKLSHPDLPTSQLKRALTWHRLGVRIGAPRDTREAPKA